jgi:cell division protein FtsW
MGAETLFYSDVKDRSVSGSYDFALVWAVLLLLALGLVMVYSSSIAIAEGGRSYGQQPAYFLLRQGVYLVVSFVLAMAAFQVPVAVWQKGALYLFLLGVGLLALVLIPGVGREVNGSQRWLSLFVVNFQPSEIMKFFAVIYAADYTVRKAGDMHSVSKGFLPMFGVMFLVGALLLREPDFGAFAVITVIAMGILFLGGMSLRLFVGLILLLVVGFILLIWYSPYRLQRVIGFMDPWADPYGKGYQLSHALIAFGRGEWLGVGLGASVEKLFYLPEAHTDFLLAVIAEELGFIGVLMVILAFSFIVTRAFAIGRQASQLGLHFAALAAQGIGIWIGVQTIINMGVNMGVLPTKGLTLPLLSYGGSSIAANCCALAVLLRIDWENRSMMRGTKV